MIQQRDCLLHHLLMLLIGQEGGVRCVGDVGTRERYGVTATACGLYGAILNLGIRSLIIITVSNKIGAYVAYCNDCEQLMELEAYSPSVVDRICRQSLDERVGR